ncbi:MAG: ABC transporter permease [Chloroflexota bacterium]|nr:ABC transporter permease [Chloroflexota bacterium]
MFIDYPNFYKQFYPVKDARKENLSSFLKRFASDGPNAITSALPKHLKGMILGIIPILLLLAAWEIIAQISLVPQYILPPFSNVMQEFYRLTVEGLLVSSLMSSVTRVIMGFVLGSMAGLLLGIGMGCREILYKSFHPIFSLLHPIPALGWAPILMIWIGINEMLPIALISICSFFPVLYNTITGIKGVDREVIKAAHLLGASERRVVATIILPLALPNIFTGLRVEAAMAWRVLLAAEMVAIPSGIGALMMRSESLLQMEVIIVCLIVLAFMCFVSEQFFHHLERRITQAWK